MIKLYQRINIRKGDKMNFIYERIGKMLSVIKERMFGKAIKISGLEFSECGYKTTNLPPRGLRWTPVPDNFSIGGDGAEHHMWVKGKIIIPDEMMGKSVAVINSSNEDRSWGRTPQYLVYIDGKAVGAFDRNHLSIDIDSNVKEHDFTVYVYAEENAHIYDMSFSIREVYDDVRRLYFDIDVPYEILGYSDPDTRSYCLVRDAVNEALNVVDFSSCGEEFFKSARDASAYLEENLYQKYKNEETSCVCIGHTHIDVAWMWTFAQTREKVQRSFSTVVSLMKKYPEYKFMSSQAQLYKFLKEDAPDVYEEVKALIKEGRWEVEGAMWVEADCNIPSGESLVRQVMYGKKFFMDEFGVDCRVLWLPDAFGYSAALPQILKKSGVDYFVTSKIGWNETNRMPYDFFNWRGIDGTGIHSYFLTAQTKKRGQKPETISTYNANLCPSHVAGAYDRFQQKELSDEVIITYGYGDGGGGPTEEMIERGRRLEGGLPGCPAVKFDFAGKFLTDLDEKTKSKKIPEWRGELYLEMHRGTYTSQAKNKKNNRKSEFIYRNAELYSVMGEVLCKIPYPAKTLSEGWEKILLCQFHDVVPGSSIHPVYEDTDKIYSKLMGEGKAVVKGVLDVISKNVKTYGGLLVFNPNPFEVSAQIMAEGEWRYVEKIPSLGWAVVAPAEKEVPCVFPKKIENDLLVVEFDDDMNICRIYDKEAGREVLKSGEVANKLEAYEDFPRFYDAWEITNYYKEKKYDVNNVISCEKYECGEKAGVVVTRKFKNSVIRQIITLDGHTKNIGFETDIDWHDEHILLKSAFPFDLNTSSATYEIQYGYVQRNTHENTSWDAAKFEVCGHKYADISENGYGVSLINDCKYGYSADGSTLSLTLLKCATYPDPDADKGVHHFTYTLAPHNGSFSAAKTVENAYILNNPLECVPMSRQDGALSDKFSFAKIDGEGVVIDTVKKAEDGSGIIVRLYEATNSRGNHTLTFGTAISEVYVCDLLEREEYSLGVERNSVSLDVKPFEIVTLKVKI